MVEISTGRIAFAALTSGCQRAKPAIGSVWNRAKAFASVSDFRIQCEARVARWHNYQPTHTLTVDLNVSSGRN